ncbi:hypothetical protein TNCV_277771 [Trichonephila clavipes]|nr:hypothetical protein TNCV_277771 [Trichonephila clavipes]
MASIEEVNGTSTSSRWTSDFADVRWLNCVVPYAAAMEDDFILMDDNCGAYSDLWKRLLSERIDNANGINQRYSQT